MQVKAMISQLSKSLAQKLQSQLKGTVRVDPLALAMYSTDAGIYQIEPLCVTMPADTADVAAILQFAKNEGLTVIPRGAGSGLAGESVGRGIVMDMSVAMHGILDINIEDETVRVQPGVVLDQLNRRLAPYGKQIGPDPASGNRATIGGMIGNNSTGAHSLKYGYIGSHLREITVVTHNSETVTLQTDHDPLSDLETNLAGRWAKEIYDLLHPARDLMDRVRPKSDRNGSGYNVFRTLQGDRVNLAELIAGSEGTLAVVTEATLGLVDLPNETGLLQISFDSIVSMATAVPRIMAAGPATCELMDGTLLRMARDAYPGYRDVLPDVAASLLVEVDGRTDSEVIDRRREMKQLVERFTGIARPIDCREITDPAAVARIWAARKAAVPLLFRTKGAKQPIPVVEDVAVPIESLAEYVTGLEAITRRLDVPMAYYAHAGHGEMHPRPFLDLHHPEDVRKLRQLAEETFRLVWKLGGTISGEHGEGLVRAAFIRDQYGPEMYEIFRKIKNVFDPEGLLNPGKIINDDPDVMTSNLRFSHRPTRAGRPTNLLWPDNELTVESEQCNGNGLCRSHDPLLSMCPIFRVTGDEDASPRAKGNLMRHWLTGLLPDDIMQTPEFKRVADLCVNCKMCAMQCPSLVNIPKLMMEARAEYVRHHGLTRTQKILTRSEAASRLGATFGPVANLGMKLPPAARALEWIGGIDRRRPLPAFAWGNNLKKLRKYLQKLGPISDPVGKVAYFVDLYATYNDHELGRAVVDVLRYNGVEVLLPEQHEAAMPSISYGDIPHARKTIEQNVRHLADAVRRGYTVVASEPTAALCLKQEYLDIVDSDDARLVAENTQELTDYLGRMLRAGTLKAPTHAVPLTLAYHEPCHYAALQIETGTLKLLQRIEGVEIELLPNSCCGIAGTFGFQKKNYDLSMAAGEPMLGPLRESAAQFGLTECSTCKMQMEQGSGKPTLHPVKVLARSYGLL